jgi:hypothetical protein
MIDVALEKWRSVSRGHVINIRMRREGSLCRFLHFVVEVFVGGVACTVPVAGKIERYNVEAEVSETGVSRDNRSSVTISG